MDHCLLFLFCFNLRHRQYVSLSFLCQENGILEQNLVSDNSYDQMSASVLDWSKIKFSHWELNGIIFYLSHVYVVKQAIRYVYPEAICKPVLTIRHINCYDMVRVNGSNQRKDCPQAKEAAGPCKKPRLCNAFLLSSTSTEHQQGVAVLACPAPAFLLWVVPEHKYVWMDTELRGKEVVMPFWWETSRNGVSAAPSRLKRGKGMCKTGETAVLRKHCKVNLEASWFHVAPWSHKFFWFLSHFIHLFITTLMDFNNQIKKDLCQRRSY